MKRKKSKPAAQRRPESTTKPITKRKYTKRSVTNNSSDDTKSFSSFDATECDPNSRWIIVELTEDTSLEAHHEQIERVLKDELGPDVSYFIPVYKENVQGKSACYVLFEGYIFIKRTDENVCKVFKLRTEHIKGALFVENSIRLVSGVRINKFKKDLLQKVHAMMPEKGQRVIAKVGTFKNLEGEVLSVDQKKLIAIVRFKMPSRIVDAPINIINLTLLAGS